MNWYKRSQLSTVDVIEDHNKDYLEIGHDYYRGKNPPPNKPNYLWMFHNGEILYEEETSERSNHGMVEEWKILSGDIFSGRFESATGSLSISRPQTGVREYLPIPKSILYKLYQKFPGIKQVYIF
ncbi:MAG: hypothetical protein ACTSSP_00525 [Candidatus Asgardarchaeia archaeon]